MGSDEIRAGDSDREAVAERLRVALDEGRLDLGEYDERLQRTYAARTYADLEGLTTDLPGTVPPERSQVEQSRSEPPGAVAGEMREPGGPPFLAGYGGVVVLCVLIWGITSLASHEFHYFWPAWMLIPLVLGYLGGRGRRDGRGGS